MHQHLFPADDARSDNVAETGRNELEEIDESDPDDPVNDPDYNFARNKVETDAAAKAKRYCAKKRSKGSMTKLLSKRFRNSRKRTAGSDKM